MRKIEKERTEKTVRVTDITPVKEQNNDPIRLAAYCRVSSSSEDQLHSFAAQIRHYKDYEKKHPEYKLVDIYADEGITGTSMDKRDELNRMLKDCQRGKIDRIVTKSVSRLARNTQDILNMVRMLKDIGVSIYFEEQGLDSGTMNFEMFLTLPGMAAQQESMAISQNLRWSNRKRMESGDYKISRPPFGYIIVNGQLEIYEPEAKIVRRIFDMYLNGTGKDSIANILNEEGEKPNSEKGYWRFEAIKYILTNEKYVGDALYQKTYNADFPIRKHRNHGEMPKYYVEDSHPAIISREKWEATQKLIDRRTCNQTKINQDNPLLHTLKCSDCGWVFIQRTNKDIVSWYNRCRYSNAHSCKHKIVRQSAVFNTFIRLTHKLKDHCSEIIDPAIKQLEILQLLTNDSTIKISDIDEEIAKLSSQMLVITKLYNNGILKQTEYAAQNNALGSKITELRSKRRKKISDDDESLDALRELRNLLQEANDQWIFDKVLFEQIVVEIIVVSNAELRFRLIGGLEFTEYIEERERCICK